MDYGHYLDRKMFGTSLTQGLDFLHVLGIVHQRCSLRSETILEMVYGLSRIVCEQYRYCIVRNRGRLLAQNNLHIPPCIYLTCLILIRER